MLWLLLLMASVWFWWGTTPKTWDIADDDSVDKDRAASRHHKPVCKAFLARHKVSRQSMIIVHVGKKRMTGHFPVILSLLFSNNCGEVWASSGVTAYEPYTIQSGAFKTQAQIGNVASEASCLSQRRNNSNSTSFIIWYDAEVKICKLGIFDPNYNNATDGEIRVMAGNNNCFFLFFSSSSWRFPT